MQVLFKNSLYRFQLAEGEVPILTFDWTERTAQMDYEDFQTTCNNYAGFAWQYQVRHLYVDTTAFQFSLPPDFPQWREEILNPRYYRLGVEKFAYRTRPESLSIMKDIPALSGKFETRHFADEFLAFDWLKS